MVFCSTSQWLNEIQIPFLKQLFFAVDQLTKSVATMCPIFPLEFCSREDKAPIHIVHFLRYQATAQNETRISNLAAGSP